MGLIFTCLSAIILYAEVANFFGAKDNIIYNIVTAPQMNATSSYFLSHVRKLLYSFLVGMLDTTYLYSGCYKLWSVSA